MPPPLNKGKEETMGTLKVTRTSGQYRLQATAGTGDVSAVSFFQEEVV